MAKKLWGGRFKKKIDKDFFEFQKSIQYDYKLAEYDVTHSLIHIYALRDAGILKSGEWKKLHFALMEIRSEIKNRKFKPGFDSEDIHTDIQNRIEKKAGPLALKLHTLRSRNDQIVFDEKYYCISKALDIKKTLVELCKSLLFLAKQNMKQRFIGYTHAQRAQAVYFCDYLFAYNDMFQRDASRLGTFFDNLFVYIGAGALTGSTLSRRNYDKAIKNLPFLENSVKIKPVENPLDNVSDRDFLIEFLSILSIIQMHLSRMSEDFILYSTKEFNFMDLPEEFCTGSSLMPHKKNPDFLELVRGSAGKVYGNLMSLLTTMKGLPLTYNRDMQLDKEPLFSSVEVVEAELKIAAAFVKGIKLNVKVIEEALKDESIYATDLAEFLVYQGVRFKEAHTIVGKLARDASDKNKKIRNMSDEELKKYHPAFDRDVIKNLINAQYSVKSKKTFKRRIIK